MQNIMPSRQRVATPNLDNGNKDRNALEDLVAAVREHVTLTNQVLQLLEEKNKANGNNNGGNNRDILRVNPQVYGLPEFKKAQPPPFQGGYNPVIVEGWLMQMEMIFKTMAYTEEQRIAYATYMLVGEVEYWWRRAKALLEA